MSKEDNFTVGFFWTSLNSKYIEKFFNEIKIKRSDLFQYWRITDKVSVPPPTKIHSNEFYETF